LEPSQPRQELVFVKLGGSVITDKRIPQTPRLQTITRLAAEASEALAQRPDLRLVMGHGSGSFGHFTAKKYETRQGVQGRAGWQGFAEVADVAARLNRIVAGAFLKAGVPIWSLQPSASAKCRDGQLESLETGNIETAIEKGLVPLLYGDVALDEKLGGTIISTEQVFAFLARRMRPSRIVLVGVVDGVFDGDPLLDPNACRIAEITPTNWSKVRAMLGDSFAADVTGGMAAKVEEMVRLVRELPDLSVHLLSGERQGALNLALGDSGDRAGGTVIHWRK
jgi:isopentenyl phosphate kinase